MSLSVLETRDLYRKRASAYNSAMWLYRAAGFRIDTYRRHAVDALGLTMGDTVVDLGCGTGANFQYLRAAVGDSGRVVGVDLTDAMLEQAKRRVSSSGWENVELIQGDLSSYEIPRGVNGILSTLAITLISAYDDIIRRGAMALTPGGRMAILDFKEPANWPRWLVRVAAWLNSPYGVSLELADRKPMESVRRCLAEVEYQEYYHGVLYLSAGERSGE